MPDCGRDSRAARRYAPAIVLNERTMGALPKEPQFHRALNDDMLVDVLQQIALRLSYGLR